MRFPGVIPAVTTPFDAHGEVDLEALKGNARSLLDAGADRLRRQRNDGRGRQPVAGRAPHGHRGAGRRGGRPRDRDRRRLRRRTPEAAVAYARRRRGGRRGRRDAAAAAALRAATSARSSPSSPPWRTPPTCRSWSTTTRSPAAGPTCCRAILRGSRARSRPSSRSRSARATRGGSPRCCDADLEVLVGGDDWALEGFAAGATGWISGVANVAPAECVALQARRRRRARGARARSTRASCRSPGST